MCELPCAQMMNVNLVNFNDDSEMVGAIVSAATLRVANIEHQSGRRSMSSVSGGRVSVDDTLDMIKLVIVGDSGVGKTCLMYRFVKDEFVTSTRATIGMDFCTRQLAVDVLSASENSVVQRLTVQVWDTVSVHSQLKKHTEALISGYTTRPLAIAGGPRAIPLLDGDVLSQGRWRDDCLRRAKAPVI